MIETLVLAGFLGCLILCLAAGFSLVYALLGGLILFCGYALYRNISVKDIIRLLCIGVKKSGNILIIFALIGFLTALWRACGTIPFIVYYGMKIMNPAFFVISVFLLCCLVSFLMGTSFGTASTVGVICMILAKLNGISPALTGGAVLSGIFFGDRCSPMSSSASLVASFTGTNLYDNIRRMFISCILPFFLTCLLYLVLGKGGGSASGTEALMAEFPRMFALPWYTAVPAIVILVFCMMKWDVKAVMALSAGLSFLLCLFTQQMELPAVLATMVSGFHPEGDSELIPLISGGGFLSMVEVSLIVMISSSYLGLLDETGLLTSIQSLIRKLSSKLGRFPAVCVASIVTSMFSCNQTLASMLTCELCKGEYKSPEDLALDLEDSVIVLAALIPWSIAGSVPLAAIGASAVSFFFAFYLYLLPLYRCVQEWVKNHRKRASAV